MDNLEKELLIETIAKVVFDNYSGQIVGQERGSDLKKEMTIALLQVWVEDAKDWLRFDMPDPHMALGFMSGYVFGRKDSYERQ